NHTVGTSGCSSDYNFFYNAPTSDNPGAHSIQGVDPLFVDAANRDYRLTSDSQARDAGLATVAPGTDLLGVARPQGSGVDMGAYEFQTDLYVSIEGSNTAGDGSEAAPYRTVPYAIDKSGLGGTVFVGPGNFTSATDGEIVMKDGVSLVGEGSDETTLTGSATAVIRAIDISEDTTISGFAITGGVGVQFSTPGNVWRDGGGVYCSSSSALSIADCVVTGNDAVIGGGIYCDKSSPTITSCSITGNWGRIGSGVYCGGLSPTITNCVVAGNDGSGEGGAIACGASSPTITNCTVADNTAWNNAFSLAGGISSGDGSSPTITNCVVWGNDGSNLVGCTATYSDIGTASVEPGFHNISADPSFVSTRTGDYRLKWGSKCIDAGTNTAASVPASAKDKDGVARPQGGSWDMGAYEFVFPTPVRLHYAAGAGGSIVGSATQVVDYGASGSSVTASPSANYRFVKWSDESTQNPRTDTNVTADVNVIATFTPAAPNLTTVWRFRSATMVGSYLWTPDPTEAASIKANLPTTWIYEGAAFTINRDNPLNSNQMYRFRNKLDWTYFYTADLAEKANLENNLSATWELEGPAWKVSLTETPMPVWRFRCLKNSTHFWTSDPNEKLTIENTLKGTYQLEGVAYYLGQ
ncbi:MAG: choice-of-anchor Q domain-containing protein, partial [Coriobacteriia bacterium]